MNESRIIIAQGPCQILTAISVLRHRAHEQPGKTFDDVLILGNYCGANLDRECLELSKLWNFSSIFYFHEFETLCEGRHLDFQELTGLIRRSYNIQAPSEIYVCRNWQPINEVFLAAYPESYKICYGDGFGWLDLNGDLNGFGHYHPPIVPLDRKSGFTGIDLSITTMPIDQGNSFSLAPVRKINSYFFEKTIKDASKIEKITTYCNLIKNETSGPLKLVLTSTLAQSSMCRSIADEIEIYLSVVLEHTDPGDTILIKGHPREVYNQSLTLTNLLKKSNRNAKLVDEKVSRYPIELLAINLPLSCAICLGSSSCIAMAYFNCGDMVIGYGEKILEKHIPENIKKVFLKREYALALITSQGYLREFHPIVSREINKELENYDVYHKNPITLNSTSRFNLYEYLKICSSQ
jgi:hypothetical protein